MAANSSSARGGESGRSRCAAVVGCNKEREGERGGGTAHDGGNVGFGQWRCGRWMCAEKRQRGNGVASMPPGDGEIDSGGSVVRRLRRGAASVGAKRRGGDSSSLSRDQKRTREEEGKKRERKKKKGDGERKKKEKKEIVLDFFCKFKKL